MHHHWANELFYFLTDIKAMDAICLELMEKKKSMSMAVFKLVKSYPVERLCKCLIR